MPKLIDDLNKAAMEGKLSRRRSDLPERSAVHVPPASQRKSSSIVVNPSPIRDDDEEDDEDEEYEYEEPPENFDLPEYKWENEEGENEDEVEEQEELEDEEEEEEEEEKENIPNSPVNNGGIVPKASRSTKGFSPPALVPTLLFLLILVNLFSSGQFTSLSGALTKRSSSSITGARSTFLVIGGEVVFLIFLSLIAEGSDTANKMVITFIVLLWLLWGFHNRNVIASFASKVLPQTAMVKQGGGKPTV